MSGLKRRIARLQRLRRPLTCRLVDTEIKAGIPSHVTADLNAPMQVTEAEIRERMSGNICRCGAYSNIVEAMTEGAGRKA